MTETTYTPEIGEKICDAIVEGESGKNSLREVCKLPGMPSRATVYRWLRDYPDFAKLYELATDDRADGYMDEIVDIAENCRATKSGIAKAKLQIYAREKYAAKIRPRKYGEKVDVNHGGQVGNPVETVTRVELVPLSK